MVVPSPPETCAISMSVSTRTVSQLEFLFSMISPNFMRLFCPGDVLSPLSQDKDVLSFVKMIYRSVAPGAWTDGLPRW